MYMYLISDGMDMELFLNEIGGFFANMDVDKDGKKIDLMEVETSWNSLV